MLRATRSAFLVFGGSTEGKEDGCLRTAEKVTVELEGNNVTTSSALLNCHMNSSRRSPSLVSASAMQSANDLSVHCSLVGGCSQPGRHLTTAENFNGSSFHLFDTHLQAQSCAAFCTFPNGRSIIVGGYDGLECLNSVYSIEKDFQCKSLKQFPNRLKNATATPINEKDALIIGGWDETRTLSTIFRLNGESGETEMVGLMPRGVEGHSTVRVGPHILVFGGFDGFQVTGDIFRLDCSGNRAEKIVNCELSTPRENHVAVVLGDRLICVAGGWDGFRSLRSIEYFLIESLEPLNLSRLSYSSLLCVPRNRPAALAC